MPPKVPLPYSAPDRAMPNRQLREDPVLAGHQHIRVDLKSGAQEAGKDINVQDHLSSNTKIAVLAMIARIRGVDYIQENMARFRKMMSLSHNDATVVEFARAINHPSAERLQSGFRPLSMNANGTINRKNDNHLANTMGADVLSVHQAYRKEFAKYKGDLGVENARIRDTSGYASTDSKLGTSEASPQHIAKLMGYLYNLDGGKTLRAVSNPGNGPHTTSAFLGNRGDQVFFAKTGTLSPDRFRDLPGASQHVREKFPNGVFVLTMGYMQDGQPKMAFFRASSNDERKELANQFLDHVAGAAPQAVASRQAPRRTTAPA